MSPKLRLRHLQIHVDTSIGPVGTTIRFAPGLNVIRADNSSGKSTTLQAIIYALGLEGMLSASREIPLPHAVTDEVVAQGRVVPVRSSWVALEIENEAGEVIVVRRHVKSDTFSNSLVSVEFGPGLSSPADYRREDYFVRRSGAAVREAGFHAFLAAFIGWQLPPVSRMDGSEVPLYMETLFPYIYVEQKHGWSGLQARIPTYFRIREVGKRSAEFLLGMEFFRLIQLKQRIESNLASIEGQWKDAKSALLAAAAAGGIELAGVPKSPLSREDDDSIRPLVFLNGAWLPLRQAIRTIASTLAEATSEPVSSNEESAGLAQAQLSEAETELQMASTGLGVLLEERELLRNRETQLRLRVESLSEDLQRHRDSATLQKLGSLGARSLPGDACPTCHQPIHDGMDVTGHAMSIEENIRFIERQLKTFRVAATETLRVADAIDIRIRAVRESANATRSRMRTLRESLTAASGAPSIADISRRAALQSQLERLDRSTEEILRAEGRLTELSAEYTAQHKQLRKIDLSKLSTADEERLTRLQNHVRDQLQRFHFKSLPPSEIDISRDTYRPAHEGFDLGFDISASDMIRAIWAYLIGILRVSHETGANHLGLLIFDEPKQQDTADESYRQLLLSASEQGKRGSQVIFATSEESSSLRAMLAGADVNLIDFAPGAAILS